MKKIPTIYERDFSSESKGRYVTEMRNLDCSWVFKGEGVPTRKYDGTCTKYEHGTWWTRREIKPGKAPTGEAPFVFVQTDYDEVTGKRVGWEPAAQSSFIKYLVEAVEGKTIMDNDRTTWGIGAEGVTYELVGPKVNTNPMRLPQHILIRHGYMSSLDQEAVRNELKVEHFAFGEWWETIQQFHANHPDWEGIVWHHPDGRMAKIKGRDFRR